MYVKVIRDCIDREDFVLSPNYGERVVPKETIVFRADRVKFSKYYVDKTIDRELSKVFDEATARLQEVEMAWGSPQKDKYEFIVIEYRKTLENDDGVIHCCVAFDCDAYLIDENSGKTIDSCRCFPSDAIVRKEKENK